MATGVCMEASRFKGRASRMATCSPWSVAWSSEYSKLPRNIERMIRQQMLSYPLLSLLFDATVAHPLRCPSSYGSLSPLPRQSQPCSTIGRCCVAARLKAASSRTTIREPNRTTRSLSAAAQSREPEIARFCASRGPVPRPSYLKFTPSPFGRSNGTLHAGADRWPVYTLSWMVPDTIKVLGTMLVGSALAWKEADTSPAALTLAR